MTENTHNTPKTPGPGTFLAPHIPPSAPSIDRAALALLACSKPLANAADAAAFRDELVQMQTMDAGCNDILFQQSRVLDAFFNRCVVAAMDQTKEERDYAARLQHRARNAALDRKYNMETTPEHPQAGKPTGLSVDQTYADLALRAQQLCAHTVDTLSRVQYRHIFANKLIGPEKAE